MTRSLLVILGGFLVKQALAGTGVGNEFKHVVEESFDYHMAYPGEWAFEDVPQTKSFLRQAVVPIKEWALSNHPLVQDVNRASSIRVRFFVDFPAENVAELMSKARQMYPQVNNWIVEDDGPFVLVTSGDIPDSQTHSHGVDFYLTDRRMVVVIDHNKDTEANGVRDVEHIMRSIDRASVGPRILSLKTDKAQYQVGDQLCYFLEVDDLQSKFDKKDLIGFRVRGRPQGLTERTIEWVGERNWFRVCMNVDSGFDRDGAKIDELTLSSGGREFYCELTHDSQSTAKCGDDMIPVRFGVIDNPRPDLDGPAILALELADSGKDLRISFQDDSGLYIGRVDTKNETYIIYPDMVRGGEIELDLSLVGVLGWQTIKSVVLADANGRSTILKSGECDDDWRESTTYSLVSHGGSCQSSNFPIVKFFLRGETQ